MTTEMKGWVPILPMILNCSDPEMTVHLENVFLVHLGRPKTPSCINILMASAPLDLLAPIYRLPLPIPPWVTHHTNIRSRVLCLPWYSAVSEIGPMKNEKMQHWKLKHWSNPSTKPTTCPWSKVSSLFFLRISVRA
jgi:hypothetical protein